jgi:hypothetical protein
MMMGCREEKERCHALRRLKVGTVIGLRLTRFVIVVVEKSEYEYNCGWTQTHGHNCGVAAANEMRGRGSLVGRKQGGLGPNESRFIQVRHVLGRPDQAVNK